MRRESFDNTRYEIDINMTPEASRNWSGGILCWNW